jgi:arylsulfatase A-like enzyme
MLPGCSQDISQPNIVFIMSDDLGYGELGTYGQQSIKTPNLDRLAREGMRFTQHYAGSTVCAPSRCSFITGLHTGHTHVRGNMKTPPIGQLPLPEGTFTLPGMLKDVGYRTGLIGKWGLGGPESTGAARKQGFDYFFGYLDQSHAHNYYPEFLFRNEERIPLEGNVLPEPKREDGAGVAIEKSQYSHDLFIQEALAFIEKNKGGPFFLFLALTIPHANNEARNEGMEVPSFGEYETEDWPEQEKGKAAMISRMDEGIGQVMRKLRSAGIDHNTLVFFTSDNGPHREGGADPSFFSSSGPLRGIKRDLYEGGIRVPLLVRWPGKIRAGSESQHVSAFWDYLPTFAELTSRGEIRNTDGISFLPALLGDPANQSNHEFLYWEFHERGSKQAVRLGNWKGIRDLQEGRTELYNLKDDPGESADISGKHPEVVKKIEDIMDAARTPSEFWPMTPGS